MFISLILMLISLISILTFIVLLFVYPSGDSSILFLLLSFIISYLVGILLFYKTTNKYPLNDVSEYHVSNFKKMLIKNGDFFEIQFFKKDGFWLCVNNSQLIKLNLGKYLFQKSYLISFVVRNLRYPLISKKLPLKYLFVNKFFIKEDLKVKLILINGDKRVEKFIIINGMSRYGLIAKHITFSPFYQYALSNRTLQGINKSIPYIINERIYQQRSFIWKIKEKSD